jgi:hypothetical protein
MMRVGTLTWGNCPGLFRWAQLKCMFLKVETFSWLGREVILKKEETMEV